MRILTVYVQALLLTGCLNGSDSADGAPDMGKDGPTQDTTIDTVRRDAAPSLEERCYKKYGKAFAFTFCPAKDKNNCMFYSADEGSCKELCTKFGGVCRGGYAFDHSSAEYEGCPHKPESSCDIQRDESICVCSL